MSEVPVDGTPQQRIAAIAERQRGRVSRAQLLRAGLSGSAIARLVVRGSLWTEYHGVYAVGNRADAPGAAQTSALLAVRRGACLSHGSAWQWWTAAQLRPSAAVPTDDQASIHLTMPGNRSRGPAGVIVHRSTILVARDRRVRDGLPVTSPARTLLDLAAGLDTSPRQLERAVDTAFAQRLVTSRDLADLVRRSGRHAGRAALEALTDGARRTTFTRSEAEERLLALVRAAGLPAPLVNVRRHGYEIDFLWPQEGVAVEVDGYAYHSGRASFERDRRRDQDLLAAGVSTLRITWRQLTDEPLAVAARLAAALAGRRSR